MDRRNSPSAALEETPSLLTRAVQAIDSMSTSGQRPGAHGPIPTRTPDTSLPGPIRRPGDSLLAAPANLRTHQRQGQARTRSLTTSDSVTHEGHAGSLTTSTTRLHERRATSSSDRRVDVSRSHQGGSSYQRERLNLFRPRVYGTQGQKRGKRKKIAKWEHDFCCLASTMQDTPPTPMQKAALFQAGLGMKNLHFLDSDDASLFLDVIPLPPNGYSVVYLKPIVAQAKVYIQPIQQDLSTEVDTSDDAVCLCLAIYMPCVYKWLCCY